MTGGSSAVDRLRRCQRSSVTNRRCADCTERGPTYVCLDFQTFVCQSCSGIHREFGHRMKSISLSEWTEPEVSIIEAGGNERAAQTWLARWNKDSHPEPDSSGSRCSSESEYDKGRAKDHCERFTLWGYAKKRWQWYHLEQSSARSVFDHCARLASRLGIWQCGCAWLVS